MMDRTAWDKAVHELQLAELLEKACFDFGPGAKIKDRYLIKEQSLEHRYGKRQLVRADTDAAKEFSAAVTEYDEAMEAIYPDFNDRTLEAAERLALTPAPDIEALRLKIDTIKAREIECYEGTEHIFDVVRADVERLAASPPSALKFQEAA